MNHRSLHRTLASLLIIWISLASTPLADNWPQWRGPSATGVSGESALPERWSDTDNIAWKAAIDGTGVSSPIVWDNQVFVTSQTGSGGVLPGPRLVQGGDAAAAGERPLAGANSKGADAVAFLVTAFDRATGKRAWQLSVPATPPFEPVHEKHNLASPSPVTDGERVYAWFATGQIAAVDMQGKSVWQKHLGAEYAPFDIQWGHGSSPVVYNDQLILLAYHGRVAYLLSLDARTGAVRWKVDAAAGTTSYSTPLVVETAGRAEIIVNSSSGVSGHDLKSGTRLWHVDETNRFPVPTPLFSNGVIYTSRGYRSSPFWAIRPGGSGDVSATHVPWRVASGAPYISSLVHYDGLIYMMGDVGVLSVVDAATGERVFQERLGGVYTASPVAGDGKVYLFSEDGETIVLAAGRTPRVLARNRLNARQLASPAVAGGRLFIRSDDALLAVGK